MNLLKSFLTRLFIVAVPILGLYFYSEIVFEANRQKEHPTDAGMGIAILLFLLLLCLFLGFVINTIIKFRKKEYPIVMVNAIFLSPFLFLILYLQCLFVGGDGFCEFITKLDGTTFTYIIIIVLILISVGFLVVYKCSFKIIFIYLMILSSIGGGYFYNRHVIKEHYGKNKEMYFEGKINDTILVLASDNMSVLAEGYIERKTYNRIFIKSENKTIELNDWLEPIKKEYSDSIKCQLTNQYR